MTAHALTTAAIANTAVLREIAEVKATIGVAVDLDQLAGTFPETRRDSLKRSLDKLIADRVLEGDVGGYVLTAQGERALLGIDVAEGRVRSLPGELTANGSAVTPRWPIDRVYANPDNPRQIIDPDKDIDLAKSIASAGDILQPLVLTPPDASGARMIWIGHRRYRAAALLADWGELPPELDAGLPFKESAIDPTLDDPARRALSIKTALIENSQREDLTPWEDAQGLAAYQALTGLSARAIAFDLGRAREGSETGVKDVQEKIKVAREATLDDVAKHEDDPETHSWEWLRGTTRKAQTGLTAKQRLCLVEVCDYLVGLGAQPAGSTNGPILDYRELGGDYGLVTAGLLGFGSGGRDGSIVMVFQKTWDTVAELGQLRRDDESAKDRAQRLMVLRSEVVSPSRAQLAEHTGAYVTSWLNYRRPEREIKGLDSERLDRLTDQAMARVAADTSGPGQRPSETPQLGVVDPENPLIVDGRHFPNETLKNEYLRRLRGEGGAGSPRKPDAEREAAVMTPADLVLALPPSQRLALFELARKIEDHAETPLIEIPGAATYAAVIGKYWLSQDVSDLKAAGLIVVDHNRGSGGRPVAALTAKAEDWLADIGWDDTPQLLVKARLERGVVEPPPEGRFVTDWLNPVEAESRPLADVVADEPQDDAPAAEPVIAGAEAPVDPMVQALASLWNAASEAHALLYRLEVAAGDIDEPQVPDEEFQRIKLDLQLALMAATAHAPRALLKAPKGEGGE